MKNTKHKTPAGLSAAARSWHSQLVEAYAIDDPAGLLLLQTAMEAFDRMRQAQSLIKKHGAVSPDRWGQLRPNPAATMERDARSAMLASLKALNLDIEPAHDRVGRPSGVKK